MIKKPSMSILRKNKSVSSSDAAAVPKTGVSGLGTKWQKTTAPLQQYWQNLSTRDQWALILLGLFLLVLLGGYGGYEINRAAKQQQQAYQDAVSDYFWLRGQAANINSNANAEDAAQSLDVTVNQLLGQSGIANAQVLTVGDGVQLSFMHDNQAVVSNAIDALVNQGLVVSRLNIQQDPSNRMIQVQATVSR